MTRVKICGVTRLDDATRAAELGASAVGMVFWRGSPRALDAGRAHVIANALPPFTMSVGVFVDEPLAEIEAVVNQAKLNAVQLHRGETAEAWARLTKQCRVIRAIGVNEANGAQSSPHDQDATLLVDSTDPNRQGSPRHTCNWEAAAEIARHRRVILAGGLTPENVETAILAVRPYGVDVASGVESRPGVKDPERMRAFFEAVRRADAQSLETRSAL